MERNYMAKSDPSNTFGDFSKKIKLDPSRQNLKPRPSGLTDEEYLTLAIKEGEELLAAEAKNSVKKPEPFAQPSAKLQDALAKMSDNPYVRARIELLNKMGAIARSVIEKMEKGELPKDDRYDKFCKQVAIRGDQISSKN
jgi:hypothetical protein